MFELPKILHPNKIKSSLSPGQHILQPHLYITLSINFRNQIYFILISQYNIHIIASIFQVPYNQLLLMIPIIHRKHNTINLIDLQSARVDHQPTLILKHYCDLFLVLVVLGQNNWWELFCYEGGVYVEVVVFVVFYEGQG